MQFIQLPTIIIQIQKTMNEIVWTCFTTAKVSILPQQTFAQHTNIHPQRKYKPTPQRKDKNIGQAKVDTSMKFDSEVSRKLMIKNRNPIIPNWDGIILSLRYPLRYPPIMAPIPFMIKTIPTFYGLRIGSGIKWLKYEVVKPSIRPSRTIAAKRYFVMKKNFPTFLVLSINYAQLQVYATATSALYSPQERGSKKKKHKANPKSATTVSITKYT